jgi:ribosomal protein S18 acetylase RimI-like enzyme
MARRGRDMVHRVAVTVEVLPEVTDEAVKAFGRLMPQLSRSAPPPDHEMLARVVACPANTVLIARAEPADGAGHAGEIIGSLILAIFPVPTGIRAWIEDVVVDEAARGHGAGTALTLEALRLASARGARTVDLTSRPSREAAGRLYERLGFERRETRLYRFTTGSLSVIDRYAPQYASSRVHSAAGYGTANFSEAITGPDITSIWLNPAHP